ncbi:MAG: Methylase involved in ubiquinone/menaquinone biosynthesis [Microgenomates group bacterium GW2011_GWF2_47_9]|nr:MAG: Methylase involved in ubiquinone/menaquinone biosynthesis [Microgenomates group bacterium GW2011_GWF2_47_9]
MLDSQPLYKDRFTAREVKAKNVLWQYLATHFFPRYIRPNSIVLDIGAGRCELINAIIAREKYALDPNPDLKRFAAGNIHLYHGNTHHLKKIKGASFDVIILSNLLEHLESRVDLLTLLSDCKRLLKKGGQVIVIQPNIDLVGARYWDHIDHIIPLNGNSLKEAFRTSGLTTVEFVKRFLPLTVKSNLPVHPSLIKLFLALPPIFRPFAGQSLLVAKKN